MKRIDVLIFFISCLLSGCEKNPIDDGTRSCPPFDVVPEPPYNSPIWHPSGRFIGFNHTPLRSIEYPYGQQCSAVQHFVGDSSGFWLVNSDGSNMRRIFPYKLLSPAWSPDGEWIAFVLGAQIYKMRFTGTAFDTTTLVQLTSEGRNFLPAWSPDGEGIAYDSNAESPNGMNFIWRMSTDGSQKQRIAYEPSMGEIRMPSWSPDGKKIVHIRYLVGVFSSEIFVMDSNGMNTLRLTINSSDDRYPKYSSDGIKIAFWSSGNLWLMDTTGSNQHQLTTQGVDVSFGLPFSWSPDGSWIVYTRYRSDEWTLGNGTLWTINPLTGQAQQLTFNP